MKAKNDLSAEFVRQILQYDKETGHFTWLVSRGTAKSGSQAGTLIRGYIEIGINGSNYKAHRLAWLLTYNEWPLFEIDHIDGVTGDNRIAFLREATHAQNMRNRDKYACNTSGFLGVDFRADRKKWRAKLGVDGKQRHLGYFKTAEEANEFRQLAVEMLGDDFRRKVRIP